MHSRLIEPLVNLLQLFSQGSLFGHKCEWVDLWTDGSMEILNSHLSIPHSFVNEAHVNLLGSTKCLAIIRQDDDVKTGGVPENFEALSSLILITGTVNFYRKVNNLTFVWNNPQVKTP